MNDNHCLKTEYIKENCKDYVLTMLEKIKKFSMETYTHSIDVANKTLVLGKKLKLNKQDLIKLYTAGLMHDVGKLDLDINLLEKPKCTPEDLAKIRMGHIEGTRKYLEGIVDDDICKIAYHHHEKLNGTGYPQGLKGEQITKLDRILQICDLTSALSMQRSYRPKLESRTIDRILDNLVNVGELDKFYVNLAKCTFINVDNEKIQ